MLFLLLSDTSLYNHAICLQQTPVFSFLSMFANDTTNSWCHINFLSNAILPALVFGILWVHSTVSSPHILVVYMICQCSLHQKHTLTFHCQLLKYRSFVTSLPSTFHLLYSMPSAMCRSVVRAGQPSSFIFTVSDDEWWHPGFVSVQPLHISCFVSFSTWDIFVSYHARYHECLASTCCQCQTSFLSSSIEKHVGIFILLYIT